MSFVDNPMSPVKKCFKSKIYVLSTDSSTIVFRSAFMLLLFSFIIRAYVCLSCSCEQNDVVACAGTCTVLPGSTDALYTIGKIVVYSVSHITSLVCPWFPPPSVFKRV